MASYCSCAITNELKLLRKDWNIYLIKSEIADNTV